MLIPYSTDAPLYHRPWATIGLIAVNIGLFVAVTANDLSSAPGQSLASKWFILQYGTLNPLQWLSSAFMHAGIIHLLGNMIFLWAFGLVVEGKVGPVVFTCLYLGIAVTQSAIEQMFMLGADGGGSLGASAAIFGLLGLAVVWAPSNSFDVIFLIFFRAFAFEIPILMFGSLSLVLETVSVALGTAGAGSSMLHLMGLFIGIGVGFVWLRREWVDCEGWDLVNVIRGTEHGDKLAKTDQEADELLRSTRRSRRKTPPARATSTEPDAPASDDDVAVVTEAQRYVAVLIEHGHAAAAVKALGKLRKDGTNARLPQSDLYQLIKQLLQEKQYSAATPLLSEHLERFQEGQAALRLRLARILLSQDRPRAAVKVLRPIKQYRPSAEQLSAANSIFASAQQQIAEGTMELGD